MIEEITTGLEDQMESKRKAAYSDERRIQVLKKQLESKQRQIDMLKDVIRAKDNIYLECCNFIAFMSMVLQKDYFEEMKQKKEASRLNKDLPNQRSFSGLSE